MRNGLASAYARGNADESAAMNQPWQSVIGLEVHVQLKTRSKIFSGAATDFGADPNAQACSVDLALPGVLPVLNAEVVRAAVLFGLAVQGRIAERCRFDRKNYFYPDLPKGYQISQLDEPIVSGGHLTIEAEDGTNRRIDLTRAHLEEDAGKSLHEAYEGHTGIDLNRAGIPLLEVVSEPQLRTPAEAARYFRALHALVRYLDICDGDLSQGSMRCDANVSVRRPGDALGERTEIKNLNSFRFLEKAVRFEIERQIDLLESGGQVERQTLLYDAERDETRPMRGKELSDDYRYFPDPDLLRWKWRLRCSKTPASTCRNCRTPSVNATRTSLALPTTMPAGWWRTRMWRPISRRSLKPAAWPRQRPTGCWAKSPQRYARTKGMLPTSRSQHRSLAGCCNASPIKPSPARSPRRCSRRYGRKAATSMN